MREKSKNLTNCNPAIYLTLDKLCIKYILQIKKTTLICSIKHLK